MPWHHVTSWHHTIVYCFVSGHLNQKTIEITLFSEVTLNFDLWPWPSNSSKILSRLISLSNFMTIGQTVQPWERSQTDTQTDRHTDEPVFITSTADAGGNKPIFICRLGWSCVNWTVWCHNSCRWSVFILELRITTNIIKDGLCTSLRCKLLFHVSIKTSAINCY